MRGPGTRCKTHWMFYRWAIHPDHTRSRAPRQIEATYLRRPDLGRQYGCGIGPTRIARGNWDLCVGGGRRFVGDGRASAMPIAVIDALLPRLVGWRIAPVCIVRQGRVAIGDEIGERIGARLVVVLIGEHPGLSSPDSLGAYLTWAPRIGRTDAERNCVSNIRNGGLEPVLAAQRIAALMHAARDQELTGVNLRTSHLLRCDPS